MIGGAVKGWSPHLRRNRSCVDGPLGGSISAESEARIMTDPTLVMAQADAVLERTGTQLRELLRTTARSIEPFPDFPGSLLSTGIEVPDASVSDRGCIVLAEDGELYELQIGIDVDALAAGAAEPVLTRDEHRVPLTDLRPAEYVALAYRALEAATSYLERRGT